MFSFAPRLRDRVKTSCPSLLFFLLLFYFSNENYTRTKLALGGKIEKYKVFRPIIFILITSIYNLLLSFTEEVVNY